MPRYKDELDYEYKYHRRSPSRRTEENYHEIKDRDRSREERKIRRKDFQDNYQDSRGHKNDGRFEKEKRGHASMQEKYHLDTLPERIHVRKEDGSRKGAKHHRNLHIYDAIDEDDIEHYYSYSGNSRRHRADRRDREDRSDMSVKSNDNKCNDRDRMYDDHYYHPEHRMGQHEDKMEKRLIRPSSEHAKRSRDFTGGNDLTTKAYIYERVKDGPIEASYREMKLAAKENRNRLPPDIIRDDESRVSSKSNKSPKQNLKSNRLDAIDEHETNRNKELLSNHFEIKESARRLNGDEENRYYRLNKGESRESKRSQRREYDEEYNYYDLKERKSKESSSRSKQRNSDKMYGKTESYKRKESIRKDDTYKSTSVDDHSISSSKRKGLRFLRIFKRKESEEDNLSNLKVKGGDNRRIPRQEKEYYNERIIESDDFRHREKERDVYADNVNNRRHIDRNDRVRSKTNTSLGYDEDDYYRLSQHKYKPRRERERQRYRTFQDDDYDDRSRYSLKEEFEQMRIQRQKKSMPHYQEGLSTRDEIKVKKSPSRYESEEISRYEDHVGKQNIRERPHRGRDIDGYSDKYFRRKHEPMYLKGENGYVSDDLTDEKLRSSVQSLESFSSVESRAPSLPQRPVNEKASIRNTSPQIKKRVQTRMIANTDIHKGFGERNQTKDEIPKSALSLAVLSDIKKGDVALKEVPTEEKKDNNDILSQIRNGTKLNSRIRTLSPKPEKPMTILDEIKKGKQLKKAEPSSKNQEKESRYDALSEIKARRKREGNSKNRYDRYGSDEWT